MSAKPSIVALIPARAGSKRVKGKNVRPLHGHPTIAYTIRPAVDSGVFDAVIVSTDSEEFAEISRHYGAEVPFLRPDEYAGDKSPDIEWLRYTLERLGQEGRPFDCFSILRPTSPFRKADTIRRAWQQFQEQQPVDSLRAVELCEQHPGKMWVVSDDASRMEPLLKDGPKNPPWHSTPYQALPRTYIQNASLEIAWSRVVLEDGTIAGETLTPFLTEGDEGYDINRPEDLYLGEYRLENGDASLPPVSTEPWQG